MPWTTPEDIRAQVRKRWDRGQILTAMVSGEPLFPLKLVLKGPDSRQLSEQFADVQAWIARLSSHARHYRISWRQINHRILGPNDIPAEIWVDQPDDALALIGERQAAGQFAALVSETRRLQPDLLSWLARRPLRALELAEVWPQLLSLVSWLSQHPRPSIYLRQIDLPGVHSKLIETHRGVLSELFDLVLPAGHIDPSATGSAGFCRRYGFLDKPARVRFRILDPAIQLYPASSGQDLTVTATAFAERALPVSRVFITENEINFLAFPEVSGALVIFGAGYGFDHLAAAAWLLEKAVYYWGDLDTHGFAILNQLRSVMPHALSFLMDEQTLLGHMDLWGLEDQPETGSLMRLNAAEQALYDQLRQNRLGDRIRLEQERIRYQDVLAALRQITGSD